MTTKEPPHSPSKPNRWWLVLFIPICIILALLIIYQFLPLMIGHGDCIWDATAQAWVDSNGNGIRDPSDPPLPGVTFHVNDTLNGYTDVGNGDGPTDWKGEVKLVVWLPGCPNARFEVYPDIPPGYRALSDSRPTADDGSSNLVFEFGFAQIPSLATITPRPSSPACVSYRLGLANRYDITDIDIAADGSVWVATYDDGLRSLPLGGSDWVYIKTQDGLINNQVRSITPLVDGSIWFGTEGGASHLDSNSWTSYTDTDGLINNNVYGIAVSPNGDVWFATAGGVSYFDSQTLTWASVSYELVNAVAVSSDGIPWAAPFLDDEVRVVQRNSEGLQFGNGFDFNYADQLLFASDGKLWIAGTDGVGQYDPSTGVLNIFDRTSTQGAIVDGSNALDIAPDGSVWIAATTYSPVIYHFLPWLDTNTASAWEIYDQRDGLPTLPSSATNNDTVNAIAVAPSGEVWIATTEHATRCHFEK